VLYAEQMIPVDDGVSLAADVYAPPSKGWQAPGRFTLPKERTCGKDIRDHPTQGMSSLFLPAEFSQPSVSYRDS
jgi:predicted acyl esterase